jgi:hypothetical protein
LLLVKIRFFYKLIDFRDNIMLQFASLPWNFISYPFLLELQLVDQLADGETLLYDFQIDSMLEIIDYLSTPMILSLQGIE